MYIRSAEAMSGSAMCIYFFSTIFSPHGVVSSFSWPDGLKVRNVPQICLEQIVSRSGSFSIDRVVLISFAS